MRDIEGQDIVRRMEAENPWWARDPRVVSDAWAFEPRAYFELFYPLVTDQEVRRAVVLLGPRRVGKTVMLHHTAQRLIASGVDSLSICYVAIDNPIYNQLGIESLLQHLAVATKRDVTRSPTFVFLDEIQYLRDWERHLKTAVDAHPNIKFVASGSAAAALRLRSTESGAGRFTDFLLPPLTFHEFLVLLRQEDLLVPPTAGRGWFETTNLEELNNQFLQYVNFGGYPEAIFSERIRADPERFIKSDIIDKVLLRDLPSLYGIEDIQELNYLFTTLAFNTAGEVSLEELSKKSGVAKNTIKRYIQYLEAAFLVKVVHRVDRNARRFKRATRFKVYLTNPSMRAALFSKVAADDAGMESLTETAIFSQWLHSRGEALYYARWDRGEVDLVCLAKDQRPSWAVEVKWSDRYFKRPEELAGLWQFCKDNKLSKAAVTTISEAGVKEVRGITFEFVPASLYCYTVGYNLLKNQGGAGKRGELPSSVADEQIRMKLATPAATREQP